MMTQAYRLTTTVISFGAETRQETVVISAENEDEAIDLARSYVEAVAAVAVRSASLADASGKIIWWKDTRRNQNDKGIPYDQPSPVLHHQMHRSQ